MVCHFFVVEEIHDRLVGLVVQKRGSGDGAKRNSVFFLRMLMIGVFLSGSRLLKNMP
jgi:hypothetical protein